MRSPARTIVQPVVLRPVQVQQVVQRQEVVGITPFAVRMGYHLRPQISLYNAHEIGVRLGNVAYELNYGTPGWEDRCAVEVARVALFLGADRIDEALCEIAGWTREPVATPEAEPQATPQPQNEWR